MATTWYVLLHYADVHWVQQCAHGTSLLVLDHIQTYIYILQRILDRNRALTLWPGVDPLYETLYSLSGIISELS